MAIHELEIDAETRQLLIEEIQLRACGDSLAAAYQDLDKQEVRSEIEKAQLYASLFDDLDFGAGSRGDKPTETDRARGGL